MPDAATRQPAADRLRDRTLAAVVCAVGLGSAARDLYAQRMFFHDDAYISLRYARNLVEGRGLVWNPGEYVEGFTNFLHTLLVALLGALSVDYPVGARVVNFASLAALGGFLFWFFLRRTRAVSRSPSWLSVAIPFALTLATPPLLVWALGGLEAPLFTLLATVGLLLTVDILEDRAGAAWPALAGGAFALAVLTRPDGIIFAAGAFAALLVSLGRTRRRAIAAFTAALAIPVALHLAFRLWYYGDWLPNTYYVKSTGLPPGALGRGLPYVADFARTYWWYVAALAVAIAWPRRSRRLGILLVAGAVLVYAAGVASVGGDQMVAFRALVPLVPLCAFLLHEDLRAALDRTPRAAAIAAAAFVAVIALQAGAREVYPEAPPAIVGRLIGRHIESRWRPGSVVALNTAGSTPYYAPDFQYIDMLGLNDPVIARRRVTTFVTPQQAWPGHAKGDGRYVLDREPDYIIIGPAEGRPADAPWFLSDVEIAADPRFARQYELREERLDVSALPERGRYAPLATGTLRFQYYARTR